MRSGSSKPKNTGSGLSEGKSRVLSGLEQDSNLSKSDILLIGLELLAKYYSLGLNKPPLNLELRNLETEAIRQAEARRQTITKEKAIEQMVEELSNVEKILEKYHNDKDALIQILLDIQSKYHWLSKPALIWVSSRLGVPWSQIYHIATFYKAFSLVPRGRHLVQVCLGTACQVRGGPLVLDRVMEVLKLKPGETDQEQKFTLDTVNCLGCCALGPVVAVDKNYYSNPSVEQFKQIADSYD